MSEFEVDPIGVVIAAHIAAHPGHMTLDELHATVITVRRAFEAPTIEPKPTPEPIPAAGADATNPLHKTAREIRASIKPDGLISFEDGKTYKTLTRHLSRRNMTPQDYRQKYGLRVDYPMVAPEYSRKRSELAKKMRLGHK